MGDDQGRVGDLSLDRCPAGGGFGAYRSSGANDAGDRYAWMEHRDGLRGDAGAAGPGAGAGGAAGEAQRSGRRVSSRRLLTRRGCLVQHPLSVGATRPAVSSAASGMPCAHNRRDQPPRRIGRPLPIAASTNPGGRCPGQWRRGCDVGLREVLTLGQQGQAVAEVRSRRGRFRSACHAASAASCEGSGRQVDRRRAPGPAGRPRRCW